MNNFMIKPTSYHCNIDCDYCFYLEKEQFMRPDKKAQHQHMSIAQAKVFIHKRMTEDTNDHVYFTWQGGEPLLMGLDFFQAVVDYQQELAQTTGKKVANAIQTNGILLSAKWCRFLKQYDFLVGISIDGDQALHDRYRVSCSGNGTFSKVFKAIELLKTFKIEFNTLTVVNSENVKYPIRVYRFLKSLGVKFMQFIPVVETVEVDEHFQPLWLTNPEFKPTLTPFSVDPIDYAHFMITIFHEWARKDIQNISIRLFDSYLERFFGYEPSECIFRKKCGGLNLALEANGDIYQCDHFVYPSAEFKVGNINQIPYTDIAFKTEYLSHRKEDISQQCKECTYLELCHGGCPKHRFLHTATGEPLSYFCSAYQTILGSLTVAFNLIVEFFEKKIPIEHLAPALDKLYPQFKMQPEYIRITNL